MRKKRYNIALIEANVMDKFSNEIVKGAMDAAEKCDVNLTIFPVKYINHNADQSVDSLFEYQYNALLSLAASGEFDYIIISIGSIAYACDREKKVELLNGFSDVPVLCVCDEIPGYDFVRYENASGVESAVNYLVQTGRKHICMMVGDSDNVDCKERFDAYCNALAKNGMQYENRFARVCDLAGRNDGEIEILLDENPEVDAIVCATDMIAASVCEAIKGKNRRVGEDIAVVGFDDLPFAAKFSPPLASVRADAQNLGFQAVQKVVGVLNGAKRESLYLQSTFIPRASCMYDKNSLVDESGMFEGSYEDVAGNILRYVHGSRESFENYVTVKSFCVYVVSFVMERIVEGRSAEEDVSYICHMLVDYFDGNRYKDDTLLKIVDVFDYAIAWVGDIYASDKKRKAVERICKVVYRKLVSNLISETSTEGNSVLDYAHNTNLVTREALMFDDNLKKGYANVLSKLYALDLQHSYLYLLEHPVEYLNGEMFPRDVKWRFKAYQEDTHAFMIPVEEQDVSAAYMFDNSYLPDERRTLIVADLFSREYQYGVLLCEVQSDDFFKSLEFLVYQMSAAVKIVGLLNVQDMMLEELHTKNLSLEEVSKMDELTGIYNRRGFYEAANRLINKEQYQGKELIVCYADMDNLKTVNDTYGHVEGDYSLRTLAQCLADVFGESAVVGRLGGDEFVAVVCKEDVGSSDCIVRKKTDWIEKLNKSSAKPYNIDMSMGLFECVCKNSYDLKEAIDKADDILYTIKVARKKYR